MEKVIGIDASTVSTGVAIFKELKSGEVTLEETYLLSSNKKSKVADKRKRTEITEERIAFMITELEKIFEKYKPSKIIIEDIYGGKDMYSLKMLARFQGFVFGYCVLNNVQIEYKIANKWRKEVGIPLTDENKVKYKRKDLKRLAIQKVKELYNIDCTEDVADAICIGYSAFTK